MKRVWKAEEVIKGWQGKPIKIQMADDPFDDESDEKVGDMTIFGAMCFISNLAVIAGKQLCNSLDDASKKKSVRQALHASMETGRIELEPEVHKWLKAASEIVCPVAWQDNANEVHDIITDGYRKENEPKSKKAKASEIEGK